MFDFERLYIWRKRRRFLAPKDVLIVLPKELDIASMKQYYRDQGYKQFPDFIKYVEWFGGRLAEPEDELGVIDLEDGHDVEGATERWREKNIDTRKIGVKPFRPIEDEIAENERRGYSL